MQAVSKYIRTIILRLVIWLIESGHIDPFEEVNRRSAFFDLLLEAWCHTTISKRSHWRTAWYLKLNTDIKRKTLIRRALLEYDELDPDAYMFILSSVFKNLIDARPFVVNLMMLEAPNDTLRLAARMTYTALNYSEVMRQEYLDMIDFVFSDAIYNHRCSAADKSQLRQTYVGTLNHLPQTRIILESKEDMI